MYKKRYTSKRRYGIKKRKRTTKRSSKYARRQQKAAMTWIRKKYTKVFEMDCEAGSDNFATTISLIGAVNSADPGNTITLASVNQDAQLGTDMRLYQFFRIRGVAIKAFFPMPTDTQSSPIQWAMAYSANQILYPPIVPERAQTLATYQTGSCNQNKPISRFYNTANTYRRLGIQYCDTAQFNLFAAANVTYGGQLPVDAGSSVNFKAYRQLDADDPGFTPARAIGRLQVTYYVTYKGNKGGNSLIAP